MNPTTRTAVVVVGGGPLSERALAAWAALAGDADDSADAAGIDDAAGSLVVIAADSGLDHAVAAGIHPQRLVGDLDSISAAGRMWAYANGLSIDERSAAKDETDTEIALATAVAEEDIDRLLVLGGLDRLVDDRLDHLLATVAALGHPALARLSSVRAVLGTSEVVVVHPGHEARLAIDAGQVFSLLALHGSCHGVFLSGARWPLAGASLAGHHTRGVSNVAEDDTVVGVADGIVTVVIP